VIKNKDADDQDSINLKPGEKRKSEDHQDFLMHRGINRGITSLKTQSTLNSSKQ
jgi:hypothetical protein